MPLGIIRNDITKMKVDAIVNSTNKKLFGVSGVDGAIHCAAGFKLHEDCKKLGECKSGEAKITKGYNLPCKYVIHTVGPIWNDGNNREEEILISCYKNSLKLAKKYDCKSVAFPLISSGTYGFPKDKALRIAYKTIQEFLMEEDMLVYIVVYDKESVKVALSDVSSSISQYIDDNYVDEHIHYRRDRFYNRNNKRLQKCFNCGYEFESSYDLDYCIICGNSLNSKEQLAYLKYLEGLYQNANFDDIPKNNVKDLKDKSISSDSSNFDTIKYSLSPELVGVVSKLDESFSQALLRMIDERNMKDSDCYKKANVDRRVFSKIRSNENYRPKKHTALAFAIALELNLDETKTFLEKLGYALSRCNKFDLIVSYFIEKQIYDVFEINEALFAFDQQLLGSA